MAKKKEISYKAIEEVDEYDRRKTHIFIEGSDGSLCQILCGSNENTSLTHRRKAALQMVRNLP